MKSIVKPFPISINSRPFPKLMKGKDTKTVVLFSSPNRGMVVFRSAHHELGRYSTDWAMDRFEDFFGEVTLTESPSE